MNVPGSIHSSQNGIVHQVRSQPPRRLARENYAYEIPPLTPVFKTPAYAASRLKQKANIPDLIENVHAQFFDSLGGEHYTRANFMGVSIAGTNGAAARKHTDSVARFSLISRGLVTIMADYGDVESIPIGSYVKVTKSKNKFSGFPAQLTPFSLQATTRDDMSAIGVLYGKPDMRHKSNDARILIY